MSLDLSPGTGAIGNPRLVNAIIEEMDGGVIPFQRFMELALYHPQFGYYRSPGRVGPGGDFLTSPGVHPMFGWAVAAWCHAAWVALGKPSPFVIIEPAAGDGTLATAILDWAEGRDEAFRRTIRYVAVEPYGRGNDPRVEWVSTLPDPVAAGVLVANELFDALPVRLFEVSGRGPAEIGVRWDGEQFVEAPGAIATIDGAPIAGRFEVNPGAYPLMRALCHLFQRGAALIFDYGYPQEELWAPWRTTGTLLCFYRHAAHENPLIHVGDQDITTHVNFSELAAAAEDEGLTVFGPVSQADFLMSCGVGDLVEAARKDMGEYFARRRAVQTLTDAAGLGRVRVLAATRGLEGPLPGFEVRP